MRLPGTEILEWLAPLGQSVRLLPVIFSAQSFRKVSWAAIRQHSTWMGLEGFYFIVLSAVVVAFALVIQVLIELQQFRVHDLAGGIISVGLLREIGPLTVGLAWNVRLAARISEEALSISKGLNEFEFAQTFILPRYLAALLSAIPLVSYGLIFGFLTAAFLAPVLSVSTTNDFLDSAQRAVENKDIIAYYSKLVFLFPLISVISGSISAITGQKSAARVAGDAVTMTFSSCFVANLMVTTVLFFRPSF